MRRKERTSENCSYQVCSSEEPCLFRRSNNNEIADMHWQNLKTFFPRTTGPIKLNQTMHKSSFGEGNAIFLSNKEHSIMNKEIKHFYHIISLTIAFLSKWVYWLALFLRSTVWSMGLRVYATIAVGVAR